MRPSYDDILNRIKTAPKWYDSNGVPRWSKFSPMDCGVYSRAIAYMLIGCQGCNQKFRVASEIGSYQGELIYPNKISVDEWGAVGSFHYGDPPRHNGDDGECIGVTMNSEPIQILEFWEQDPDLHEMVRRGEFEFKMSELQSPYR